MRLVHGCVRNLRYYRERVVDAGCFSVDGYRDVLYDWRFNGRKFVYKGLLPFTHLPVKREYLTHFGPVCDVNGRCVLGSTVENYASMLLRITGNRDEEEIKTKNNYSIAPWSRHHRVSRVCNAYWDKVKREALPFLELIGDELEEQIKAACDKTHPKFKLRLKAINWLLSTREMLNGLFMTKIKGKIKIPEFAKVGKKPRLIGDYSCPGSLLAGFLVPCLKYAFSIPQVVNRSRLRFVYSTDAADLDKIFSEVDSSLYDEYIFFSDDMVARIIVDGVPKWFNLDISSCDSSNGPAVFERVKWFYNSYASKGDLVDRAVQQCQQKLVLYHPNGKSVREVVTARPRQPIEFSGTQLTTLLNNVASSAICVALACSKECVGETVDERVARCALSVGYKVTVQHCDRVEGIQFLKHSFWRDGKGDLHSFVNLGPLLRGMGTCWMDLPYSRRRGETFEGAARMRNWSVLKGFQHSGLDVLMERLAKSPGYRRPLLRYRRVQESVEKLLSEKMYTQSSVRVRAPIGAYLARYGISLGEFTSFIGKLTRLELGDRICDVVIDRVMTVDYEYPERASQNSG